MWGMAIPSMRYLVILHGYGADKIVCSNNVYGAMASADCAREWEFEAGACALMGMVGLVRAGEKGFTRTTKGLILGVRIRSLEV